jgi:uncharacterized protein
VGAGQLDIGSFSKRVLLTGAGFSRNWGGYTAAEMWSRILGDADVQENEELRGLLIEDTSFETALAKARTGSVSNDAAQKLEKATLRAFQSLDRQLLSAAISGPDWINIYSVQKFLCRFFWHPLGKSPPDTGYIFTVNQDLWLEHFLISTDTYGAKHPALPGVRLASHNRFFHGRRPGNDDDPRVNIGATVEEILLKGQFNYIKLHGSFNWRTATGEPVMVIGDHKALQISSSPLLDFYHEAFEQVLQAGDVRLMIIGYGFGDEHINSVIASAVQQCGLRVFIWNTKAEIVERLRSSAPHGIDILPGLIATENRRMIEVFPPDQRDTESYNLILSEFFG